MTQIVVKLLGTGFGACLERKHIERVLVVLNAIEASVAVLSHGRHTAARLPIAATTGRQNVRTVATGLEE